MFDTQTDQSINLNVKLLLTGKCRLLRRCRQFIFTTRECRSSNRRQEVGWGEGSLSETILEGIYRVKGRQCEGEAMSTRGLNHHDDVSNWRVRGKNASLSALRSTSPFLFPSRPARTNETLLQEWEARGGCSGSAGGGR